MPDFFTKDPSAVLDYKFNWVNWLASGETIASKTVTATSGITIDSSSITDTNTSVTVWLSGGTDWETYYITCRIVTSASRTDERTITIEVRNK